MDKSHVKYVSRSMRLFLTIRCPKHLFKGTCTDLLLLFDGKWWFRVNAFPSEKMEDRDNVWKNLTLRSDLDEKHTKKDISPNIVTSEHDMSWLVRKFRGSEDMPQRSIQTHANIPKQRILRNKSFNSFGHNLQLPSNHDRFEDGNHQRQVTMLYRILWTGNFQFSEQFFIFCYLRPRSNEDANDSEAAVHCRFRAVER